ncbi:MAG: hypothetical protein ACLRSY_05950 [Acutalibacter sp.]
MKAVMRKYAQLAVPGAHVKKGQGCVIYAQVSSTGSQLVAEEACNAGAKGGDALGGPGFPS